jgi:hypothetical protein
MVEVNHEYLEQNNQAAIKSNADSIEELILTLTADHTRERR